MLSDSMWDSLFAITSQSDAPSNEFSNCLDLGLFGWLVGWLSSYSNVIKLFLYQNMVLGPTWNQTQPSCPLIQNSRVSPKSSSLHSTQVSTYLAVPPPKHIPGTCGQCLPHLFPSVLPALCGSTTPIAIPDTHQHHHLLSSSSWENAEPSRMGTDLDVSYSLDRN